MSDEEESGGGPRQKRPESWAPMGGVYHLNPGEVPDTFPQMVARIDERTRNMARDLGEVKQQMGTAPSRAEFVALADKLKLVERVVYGAVTFICLGVLGALLALVVDKG